MPRAQTRPTLASPQILLTPDGRRAIAAPTSPAIRAKRVQAASAESVRFLALGFQQTDLSAAKGGKANSNGFRFRRGRLRAIARSFRGNPFITAHNWGDVRARGGTIVDSYAEELTDELSTGIYYEIDATADWARAGLENGTIDRFSLGVVPVGEITCTVHGAPVWSECWCFPGELVMVEVDGKPVEMTAEWEYEDGVGVELSAVNVPAVDGTRIIEIDPGDDEAEPDEDAAEAGADDVDRLVASASSHRPRHDRAVADLAMLCGREPPKRPRASRGGGAPAGGFTPIAAAPNLMAMTHEELCRMFGLPITATPAELQAKMQSVTAAAAQVPVLTEQLRSTAPDLAAREAELAAARAREAELAAQVLAQHVDAEIARLRTTRQVRDEVVASLRATATASGRSAFDSTLRIVEQSAPAAAPPVGAARAPLQSDAPPPANAPGVVAAGENLGPDAYEQHKENPVLAKFMRIAKITADDVRKHGPRAVTIVPNLAELVAASPRG